MNWLDIPDCIDALAARFANRPSFGEAHKARRQFDELRGAVYDDDDLYRTHMSAFLEWFVLEQPLDDGRTPAATVLIDGELSDEEDPQLVWSLAHSQRSLFRVDQVNAGSLDLADLVLGGRWTAVAEKGTAGLEPEDVIEARLVPWSGGVALGPVILFHPRQAREPMNKLLDAARSDGTLSLAMVHRLAEMRLRHSRFRNIAAEHIYAPPARARTAGAEPRSKP